MVLNTVLISLPPFFICLGLIILYFFYFSFVKCFSKRSN